MKNRQRTTTKVGLILLIFAVLAIAFLPLQTWAGTRFEMIAMEFFISMKVPIPHRYWKVDSAPGLRALLICISY